MRSKNSRAGLAAGSDAIRFHDEWRIATPEERPFPRWEWDTLNSKDPRFDPLRRAYHLLRKAYLAGHSMAKTLAPLDAFRAEVAAWYTAEPVRLKVLHHREQDAQHALDHLQMDVDDDSPLHEIERVERAACAHRAELDQIIAKCARLRMERASDDDHPRPRGVPSLRRA